MITHEQISHIVNKLKIWMSKIVLKQVVQCIENFEQDINLFGYPNVKFSSCSKDFLKLLPENSPAFRPLELNFLIKCFSMHGNQDFLVRRIKAMAIGDVMSSYGVEERFERPDDCPTDAAIAFHLFCVYMDEKFRYRSQLNRPFFDQFVVLTKDKAIHENYKFYLKNSDGFGLFATDVVNPEFLFFAVQNNLTCLNSRKLFPNLALFLIYLKLYQNSRLDGVLVNSLTNNMLDCLNRK